MIQQLTPHDTIFWQPQSDIIVQIKTFSSFLKTMHDPDRFHDFVTRRYQKFTPDDFIHPFLNPVELETVNRFKSLKKQIEWMTGRCLVKEMVKQATTKTKKLSDINIAHQDEGAPFLPLYPEIQISITHSGRYAAVALCCEKNRSLGLDLEEIGPATGPGLHETCIHPPGKGILGKRPSENF